jgi:hypothetical protein
VVIFYSGKHIRKSSREFLLESDFSCCKMGEMFKKSIVGGKKKIPLKKIELQKEMFGQLLTALQT